MQGTFSVEQAYVTTRAAAIAPSTIILQARVLTPAITRLLGPHPLQLQDRRSNVLPPLGFLRAHRTLPRVASLQALPVNPQESCGDDEEIDLLFPPYRHRPRGVRKTLGGHRMSAFFYQGCHVVIFPPQPFDFARVNTSSTRLMGVCRQMSRRRQCMRWRFQHPWERLDLPLPHEARTPEERSQQCEEHCPCHMSLHNVPSSPTPPPEPSRPTHPTTSEDLPDGSISPTSPPRNSRCE